MAGQAGKALEVISEVTEAQKAEMRRFLADTPIRVEAVDNGQIFDIIVRLAAGEHTASVRIAQYHTNIVHVEKDGQVLLDVPVEANAAANAAACGHEGNAPTEDGLAGRDLLTIADILDFADTCELADIRPVLDTQIQYNTQISEEGLQFPRRACWATTGPTSAPPCSNSTAATSATGPLPRRPPVPTPG